MNKKLSVFIFAIVAMMIFAMPQKAMAEEYPFSIAGVQLTTDDDLNDIKLDGIKSGKVSYNPETRTLTLDNAVIESEDYNAISFWDEDKSHAYTLVLKGNGNRLTNDFSALSTLCNLTITGGGSAQMTGGSDCGIYVNFGATLTITGGCSITVEGKYGIAGNDGSSETLIIDGATVKAKGNGTSGSICDFKEIQLNNCAITSPSGATIEGGSVMLDGSLCTKQVVITSTVDGIESTTADVPARKQGTYNLQGVRMADDMSKLPKGIYIVDGEKVVKK